MGAGRGGAGGRSGRAPAGCRFAAVRPVADGEGVGVGSPVGDGVALAVLPGVADPDPAAGGVECAPGCWLVVWDRSVAGLALRPSAPFTVQVTSASMPRPAASAMTLRRQ